MKSIAIGFNTIVIIISIVFFSLVSEYSETIFEITMFLTLIPVITFLLVNRNLYGMKGQNLRINYVFFIGFFIVFFQCNLDLLFHNITVTHKVFASTGSICPSALFSLIGLSSYVIGNALCISNVPVSLNKMDNKSYIIPEKFIFFQKLLFLFFTLTYLYYNALVILSGSFRYNEEYTADAAGSLSNYSTVMIFVLVFTILSCNIFNIRSSGASISLWKYIRRNGLLFNIPLGIYLLFVFMTGDRGPIITILLAYTITYVIACRKRISLFFLFTFIIFGGLFLSIIGSVRSQTNIVTLHDIIAFKTMNENTSIFPVTQELAGSYNTFTYSVEKVPSMHDYFYGMMQLRNIGYSVPFLYRAIPFVYSSKEYENGSTSYCTYLIQGLNRTYGNGSSLLADIYLDFGLLGIILIMTWLGYFVIKLDYQLFLGDSIYWIVIGVAFFSYSIYLSRATLVTPLYYIVPSLIIIYFRKFFK